MPPRPPLHLSGIQLLLLCCTAAHRPWPPGGAPALRFALPATIVLLLNGVVLLWAERFLSRGRMPTATIGLIVAFLLGIAFIVLEAFEWRSLTFGLSSGSYGSLFFGLEGIHMAHAVAGLLMLLPVMCSGVSRLFRRMAQHADPRGCGVLVFRRRRLAYCFLCALCLAATWPNLARSGVISQSAHPHRIATI